MVVVVVFVVPLRPVIGRQSRSLFVSARGGRLICIQLWPSGALRTPGRLDDNCGPEIIAAVAALAALAAVTTVTTDATDSTADDHQRQDGHENDCKVNNMMRLNLSREPRNKRKQTQTLSSSSSPPSYCRQPLEATEATLVFHCERRWPLQRPRQTRTKGRFECTSSGRQSRLGSADASHVT